MYVPRAGRPEVPGAGGTSSGRASGGRGDPEEAAALIEEAGGRAAALAEARRQVAAVEALAGVPLRARAPDELRSLLDFLVRRDL